MALSLNLIVTRLRTVETRRWFVAVIAAMIKTVAIQLTRDAPVIPAQKLGAREAICETFARECETMKEDKEKKIFIYIYSLV